MSIKDPFEVFVKIFHGERTQLVKHSSHLNAIIGVGIASMFGGHEHTVSQIAVLSQFWRIVTMITQNKADFSRDFAQERRRRFAMMAKPQIIVLF